MVVINLFLAVMCALLARTAFEQSRNTAGWVGLVASAVNAAAVMAAVI